jgi:hydroxymethylglutaryl-CoA reductase (NADPH)
MSTSSPTTRNTPSHDDSPSHDDNPSHDDSPAAWQERHRRLSEQSGVDLSCLASQEETAPYHGNIENPFGFVRIPLGLAGPLLIQGEYAQGSFQIPLATTEGTLVASYSRGMKAISQCGGARAQVEKSELFSGATLITASAAQARELAQWIASQSGAIESIVQSCTRHGRFLRAQTRLYGSRVLLNLYYDTADAMGINMATHASYEVCRMICEHHENVHFYLPSALQADKKASFANFHQGRGRTVNAEVLITAEVITKTLKTTASALYDYYLCNIETAHLTGSPGFNMHIANGLMALALATGQDPAYVGESANGHLIVEQHQEDLLFSLRIPSLYIGTVGGGTQLPTHKPCLQLLGCDGAAGALKLAEIFVAVALAGEISVLAAISAQQFVAAHNRLGRNKPI